MSELFYKAAGAILAPFRYAEREVNHIKEVAKEDVQAFMANVIKTLILGASGFLFLLFLSLGAASLINTEMNSPFLGFVIIGGFYLLVTIVLYIMKSASEKKHEHHATNARKVNPS